MRISEAHDPGVTFSGRILPSDNGIRSGNDLCCLFRIDRNRTHEEGNIGDTQSLQVLNPQSDELPGTGFPEARYAGQFRNDCGHTARRVRDRYGSAVRIQTRIFGQVPAGSIPAREVLSACDIRPGRSGS